MMVFLPLTEGSLYTPEERHRFIFNHESFLGNEAALCIGGLNDLNTLIKLKNDQETTIRMLLKSIPATQGMSRPQLFQFVEPNSSGMVTLASYQECDKALVEERKLTLEQELRQVLSAGEENKLFRNDEDGIWFGSVLKNKNGRIITAQQPNRHIIEHKNHLNSIMLTPPQKRNLTADPTSNPTAKHPATTTTKGSRYVIRNPSTITPPPANPAPVTRTTTPAQADHMDRFTRIEHELIQQQDRNKTFDTRISGLENTTLWIDTNVSTILAKLDQLHHTPNPAKL
jgi:hypothetical protein